MFHNTGLEDIEGYIDDLMQNKNSCSLKNNLIASIRLGEHIIAEAEHRLFFLFYVICTVSKLGFRS